LITVRCLGHIGTSVGAAEVVLEDSGLQASDIVERLRALSTAKDPGFTKFNTVLLVEGGEGCVAAGMDRQVRDGERVVLIPFSHGG
jgi:molybdopterin converting factor small subunit